MNIIIIGGTKGIGRELVYLMSKDKHNQILVAGRDKNSLQKIAENSENSNISFIETDLSVFDENMEFFRDKVRDLFREINILINNAGSLMVREFMKMSNDEARIMMETNFFGPASVIRSVMPLMAKGSHIVNISSMGGFQGSSKYIGLSYYSASKAALACLSECLAEEFREARVSVNCLALGSVQTEMFENAFPGFKAPVSARQMAEFIADFAVNGNKFFNGKVLPVAVINP